MEEKGMKLFAIAGSEKLGKKISKELGIEMSTYKKTIFADGEILTKSNVSMRRQNIFVVASTSTPVNEKIMELLIFIDMCKRASAKSISVIIPYYGYARQDRKSSGREPITAKLIADLLTTAGATRIISIDLHNPSIQGFFNLPVDDLRGQYLLAPTINKTGKFTVVSPDHGGATRARVLAELISDTIKIAIVDKRRTAANKSDVFGILGNVKNKNVVLIDDMIDTGGTIVNAAKFIKNECGARKVIIAASHGLFSRGFKLFDETKEIEKVYILDTIETVHEIKSDKVEVITVAPAIADVINSILNKGAITNIYNKIRKGM
ncbi:MAG: ribose-phosphate pyrophosphokinase [Mycoplasma sp.]|nr:ribose-phosphate pyrophosphokinase [Mycoplasma sp.]